MAHYHRTEGICLRRLDYSNTSQVATFLTPDAGRLSFLAKGATRAPKRGVRTGIDLLCRYEIIYTTRRRGSLHNLTSRWLLEQFRGLRSDLSRTLWAYYAAELALNVTAEWSPCPQFYRCLLDVLRQLARGGPAPQALLALEVEALREYGALPTFDRCAQCGGKLLRRGVVTFSAAAGGPLCSRCDAQRRRSDGARAAPFPADAIARLAAACAGHTALKPDALPPALAQARDEQLAAASAVLRFFLRDLLGKELRMWRHLSGRAAARAERGGR